MADKISLKSIEQGLRKIIVGRRSGKGGVIKKTDVLNMLSTERQALVAFAEQLDAFDKDARNDLKRRVTELSKNSGKNPMCDAYVKLTNKFNSKQARAEEGKPLSVCPETAGKMAKALDKVEKFINKKFDDKTNLYNCRFTHLEAFGAIQECHVFATVCMYLYQGVFWEIVTVGAEPPPYRIKFINKYLQETANIVNHVGNGVGLLAFDACIDELKRMNADVPIYTDEGEPNTAFGQLSKVNSTSRGFLGLSLENPFFTLLKMWTQWRDTRVRRLEEEREWMEANAALLRMELENMDRDSPEYVRKQRTVEKYDSMVSKRDAKIADYYEDAERS